MDETLNRNFGSTGLGLAISTNLVNLIGGEICVVSKPDEGSVFTFAIRTDSLSLGKESEIFNNEINGKSYNRKNKNVLITEDDDASYNYISEVLKQSTGLFPSLHKLLMQWQMRRSYVSKPDVTFILQNPLNLRIF